MKRTALEFYSGIPINKEMTPTIGLDSCWKKFDWFDALSVPTLEWAQPFLPHCKLPPGFVENLSIWDAIQRQARDEWSNAHNELLERCLALDPYPKNRSLVEAQITRHIVSLAFRKFASLAGDTVARGYEHWVRIHFFSPKLWESVRVWWKVLVSAYPAPSWDAERKQRWRERQAPLPQALAALLPTLEPLVISEKEENLRQQMYASAPWEKAPEWSLKISREVREKRLQELLAKTPPERQAEVEKKFEARPPIAQSMPSHESMLFIKAVKQTLEFEILQTLARTTSERDREEIVRWGQRRRLAYAAAQNQILVEHLQRGLKYIRPDLPDFEGTSVFDLSDEELEVRVDLI